MSTLSQNHFYKAKEFILNHARELEKSMFRYEFENGHAEEVLSALKYYQNSDKGFGNALEPDLRCSESSALATTIALQYLTRIDSKHKIQLVRDCFDFLFNTFDEINNGWEIIPDAANQAPRAIWWNYEGFQEHWGNPNAEILGYFYEYPDFVEKDFLESITAYSVEYLKNRSSLSEMHELFCYLRLLDRLPRELQTQFFPQIESFINNCIVKNPNERNGYCAVPLKIVDSPSSQFYYIYSDVLPYDLDSLINTQSEDGAWLPNWSWGRYEDEWEVARKEWKGYITLNNLRILKSFNRIDNL
ncbi:hypothetical protein [Paenibacillus sedimenti]|uniref:Uncharacterized protein n=1 Tax=Paenibacillus sedimenti TaxID=2770274 RepID=A0A926QNC5_9BACL|nr:hypothetical protein [Paenibacillus sedimenti]MBD0384868.1 hypothetical protein [Paenibacillus sedimenti]